VTKIFCFFCFILLACNRPSNNTNTILDERILVRSSHKLPQQDILNSNVKVTYKIINSIDNTFGYNIFIDDKIFIHQPVIPATIGNQGFKSEQDAKKVAELVIYKIAHGEMPPRVSTEEIKTLSIHQKRYKKTYEKVNVLKSSSHLFIAVL
jgi:hypothetical protein